MELGIVFAAAGIIIVLGYLAEVIFSKTSIPDVLWLIMVGVLIGPVFHLMNPASIKQAASIFTAFALLFILFEGGLHIRVRDLMRSMYGATAITLTNFALSVIVIAAIAVASGWPLENAVLLGIMLGGTSAAVVVPIVRKLQMGVSNSLVLILESAFTDVLSIVAALTLIQIMTLGGVSLGNVLNALFGSFAIAIFVGGILGVFWILLLEKFQALCKSYILTIGILLVVYGITEFAQSSGAIAGLTFGIVLGNARKILSLTEGVDDDTLTGSARLFFSQISFFVKTFFFVYIGILLSFGQLTPILLAVVITVAVFLIRPLSVKTAYHEENAQPGDRALMESIVPKGLAAAVLAQIPLQEGLPGAEMFLTPVIATIFFTILITTVLVFLVMHGKFEGTGAVFSKLTGKQPKKLPQRKRRKL